MNQQTPNPNKYLSLMDVATISERVIDEVETAVLGKTSVLRMILAACLSSGSLLLPHLGLWMHEGQPAAHGQVRIASSVACHHASRTSKPRSARPTPPG